MKLENKYESAKFSCSFFFFLLGGRAGARERIQISIQPFLAKLINPPSRCFVIENFLRCNF